MANNDPNNKRHKSEKDGSPPKRSTQEQRWNTFLDVASMARAERYNERERQRARRTRSESRSSTGQRTRAISGSDQGPETERYIIPNDDRDLQLDLNDYDLGLLDAAESNSNSVSTKRSRKPPGIDTDAVKGLVTEYKDLPDSIFKCVSEGGEKVYPCPFRKCDRVFPSLSRIKRHYVIHTNLKSFKCEHPRCGKRFSRRDNMQQHYRDSCKHVKADRERAQKKEDDG